MPMGTEWIIIIIIVVVLIFGAKKIPELARGFGKVSTEFEKARLQSKKELQKIKDSGTVTVTEREKLEAIAETLGIDHSTKNDSELRSAIEAGINDCGDKKYQ